MGKFRYNGVILPGFPEDLDRNVYPCAFIIQVKENGKYYLICTEHPVCSLDGIEPVCVGWGVEGNRGRGFVCASGAWVVEPALDADLSAEEGYIMLQSDRNTFLWTNTDIASNSGVLYLAASDPQAVFDLKSWMTGFAIGLAGGEYASICGGAR